MLKQNKTVKKESLTVGLRIRFDVINTIYRNPTQSVQLPSAAEFARKFNASQRTVTRELKKLVDDGYITGKHGVGTFTNPSAIKFLADSPGKNIIGIICGDGRQLFHDYASWALISYSGLALPPDIGHPRHISVTSSNPDLVYEELRSLNLDGIVWISPPEKFTSVISDLYNELPIITIFRKIPGISNIELDRINMGREIGERLIESGKSNILYCSFDKYIGAQIEATTGILQKNGIETDPAYITRNWTECEDKLTELLSQGHIPDCIYTHGESIYPIISIFKHYNIDPLKKCWYVAEKSNIRSLPDTKGIIMNYPFKEMGEQAAQWMRLLLKDKSLLPDNDLLYKITSEINS